MSPPLLQIVHSRVTALKRLLNEYKGLKETQSAGTRWDRRLGRSWKRTSPIIIDD